MKLVLNVGNAISIHESRQEVVEHITSTLNLAISATELDCRLFNLWANGLVVLGKTRITLEFFDEFFSTYYKFDMCSHSWWLGFLQGELVMMKQFETSFDDHHYDQIDNITNLINHIATYPFVREAA